MRYDTALREGRHPLPEAGVQFGRTKKLTRQQRAELRDGREGVLIKTLMQDYHLSKASVYRYLSTTEEPRSLQHSFSA